MGIAWTPERRARQLATLAARKAAKTGNVTPPKPSGAIESAKAEIRSQLIASADAMDIRGINTAVAKLQRLADLESQIRNVCQEPVATDQRWNGERAVSSEAVAV